MQKVPQQAIAAILLAAAAWSAAAAEQDAPAGAAVERVPPPADQAAMETREPHAGPTFGKSRVERRRAKCEAQAREQGLKDAALEKHLRDCVKR